MLFRASRSAYYRWAKNEASQRRKANDAEPVRLILEIAAKHLGQGCSVLRPILPGRFEGKLSCCSSEHEQEGQLLGQRLR
jgi:hypothetical protein